MTATAKLTIGALLLATAATPVSADTLRQALVQAYETNPTLNAQRESLKASDAGVAIARSAGRPSLSANAGVNRDVSRTGTLDTGSSMGPSLSVSADLSLPIFQGGRVKNDIRAAKTRVEAGRATLRAVEGDVFVEAVSAYMDVILNRAVVELNENQVRVLQTNLEATRDRFEIGDVTRTDVAQSEARLQLSQSNLATAEGRLASAEENYRRVIGSAPGELSAPPPLPPLPGSPDRAVQIALSDNPDFEAIVKRAEAAGYDVKVARASRLPTLSAVGRGTYLNALGNNPDSFPNTGSSTSVGVSSRVPIFQGGLPAARIRQAQALEGQLLEQQVATERQVISDTRSAYATYDAAERAIAANEVAVKANELALEGARLENSIGTRTILEVLNAEQELLNSQVSLVTARRDAYVAGFRLLNSMGQAEADDLGLEGGPLYDPTGNYREVAGDWSDWAGDPRHLPVSTRTATPDEDPDVQQGVTDAEQ